MTTIDGAATRVLLFDSRALPRALRGLTSQPVTGPEDVAAALESGATRLIVVGTDADLATVLTKALRTEKLDVELGFVPPRSSVARRVYRIGFGAARRARLGTARRVPLIRDDTGTVVVGRATWSDTDGKPVEGEATVDDTPLFDGTAVVDVEPIVEMPGLRASVRRLGPRRWVTGRAAQLGSVGAVVLRDGVAASRPVKRSTFYRNQQGWLLVG